MVAQRYKKENKCNKLQLLKGKKLSESDFFGDLPNFYNVISFGQGEGIFVGACLNTPAIHLHTHDVVYLQQIIFGEIFDDDLFLNQLYFRLDL